MAKNVIVSEGKAKNFGNKGTINDGSSRIKEKCAAKR